ncbi:MAG TPA: hypothetical protein VNL70_02705, partial [Tepidisphaeraceae bacterium]|nr:hypothetical protein [Tepidisphaeraceae bacterium]
MTRPQDELYLPEAIRLARKFRQLFARTHVTGCWQTCGWVRRRRPTGPDVLTHVVIPADGDGGPWGNVLWHRAADLIAQHVVEPLASPATGQLWCPDPEVVLIELRLGAVKHRIIRTTRQAWGARLVEHTGPESFWKMLLWRLQAADTVKLHRGLPCIIDRSGPSVRLKPEPCYTEADFFRWARTRYKRPELRWDQPGGPAQWTRGMEPEWYPPHVRVCVSPNQLAVFDTSKTIPPQYRKKDPRL